MKKRLIFLTFTLFIALSFHSCTIQKRTYNKGYSIQIFKPSLFSEKPIASKSFAESKNLIETKTLIKQLEKQELQAKETKETIYRDSLQPCDKIFLVDGQLINAYVIEINDDEIKYVKCDNPYGPFYFTSKKNIHKIVYPNGSSDNFNVLKENVSISPSPASPPTTPNSVTNNPNSNLSQDSASESNNTEESNSPVFSVLSFILSIILWFTPLDLSIVLMLLSILFAAIGMSSPFLRGFAILGFIITLLGMLVIFSL